MGEFSVASGVIDITDCAEASFHRQAMSDCEIRDRLQARMLLIRSSSGEALWVSLDCSTLRPAHAACLKEALSVGTGIRKDAIWVWATHTHAGHSHSDASLKAIASRVVDTRVDLLVQMRPVAELEQRVGVLPDGAIVNRRIELAPGLGDTCVMFNDGCILDFDEMTMDARGWIQSELDLLSCSEALSDRPAAYVLQGDVDPRIHLWVLRDEDGAAVASFCRANAHPVIVSQSRVGAVVSGDYVHPMLDRIDAAIGGACLFMNGAFGDVRPLAEYGFTERDRVGHLFAETALAAPPERHALPHCSFVGTTVDLATRDDLAPSVDGMRKQVRELQRERGGSLSQRKSRRELLGCLGLQLACADAGAAPPLPWSAQEKGKISLEWQLWQIGPVLLSALPGEPFVALSRDIEREADALTVGVSNGYTGYFPHEDVYDRGGYEITDSYLMREEYGRIPRIIAELADAMVEGVASISKR